MSPDTDILPSLDSIPVIAAGNKTAIKKNQEILATIILNAALTPVNDTVLWTEDEEGRVASYWLRGNANRIDIAVMREDLVIPVEGALWFWRETTIPVTLCDCAAWEIAGFDEPCPEAEDMGQSTKIHLVDRVSGEELELLPEDSAANDRELVFSAFRGEAVPIGSVGPYLFVRFEEQGSTCDNEGNHLRRSYVTLDLVKREIVDIVTHTEREKIDEIERQNAFDHMRADQLASVSDPSDLELVGVEPMYGAGGGFGILYRFDAQAVHAPEQEAWRSTYSGTVSVPATRIPSLLEAYVIPPPVVNVFSISTPNITCKGWNVVTVTDERLSELWKAFIEP